MEYIDDIEETKEIEEIKDVGAYLKSHDIKPSYPRLRIFKYLLDNRSHPTVDEIYKELVREIPTLSKMTVYNTLDLFVKKCIVITMVIEEKETRYDVDISFHGHFKCETCGDIYDFKINDLEIDFKKGEGFQINERHLYFKGICQECLKLK